MLLLLFPYHRLNGCYPYTPFLTTFTWYPGGRIRVPIRWFLPEAALTRQRVVDAVSRRGRRRAYIGSTADPSWRWRGGHFHRAPEGELSFMSGHRNRFHRMEVIGCWPDADTARMEVMAISVARGTAAHGTVKILNVADDARGLEIRPFSHSFLYVCSA